jgi:biopolymer transport protein ExbB/TolQ
MGGLVNSLAGGVAGLIAGIVCVLLFNAFNKMRGQSAH